MAAEYSLPTLPYGYDALEPHISKDIMELHHSKHHQAYVNNLNKALNDINSTDDLKTRLILQKAINFNGGGHINHSIFWQNLAPAGSPQANGGKALKDAIASQWGSFEKFQTEFTALLLGIQGSGWGWLIKKSDNTLALTTTSNQDIETRGVALFGVDMWEHAFYIQYFTNKPEYIKNILLVLNWEFAQSRWNGTAKELKL